jgi:hypothetical protein
MVQLFDLARENLALKRELGRLQEEADLLRQLLSLALQSCAKFTVESGVRGVVPDTAPEP